jgi:hypothetical protein
MPGHPSYDLKLDRDSVGYKNITGIDVEDVDKKVCELEESFKIEDLVKNYRDRISRIHEDRENLHNIEPLIKSGFHDIAYAEQMLQPRLTKPKGAENIPCWRLKYIDRVLKCLPRDDVELQLLVPSVTFDKLNSVYVQSQNTICVGTLKSFDPSMVLLSNMVSHTLSFIDMMAAGNMWRQYLSDIKKSLGHENRRAANIVYYESVTEFMMKTHSTLYKTLASELDLSVNYHLALYWILTTGYIPYKVQDNKLACFCNSANESHEKYFEMYDNIKRTRIAFCPCKLSRHSRVLDPSECIVYATTKHGRRELIAVDINDPEATCLVEVVIGDALSTPLNTPCGKIWEVHDTIQRNMKARQAATSQANKPVLLLGVKSSEQKDVDQIQKDMEEEFKRTIIKGDTIFNSTVDKMDQQEESIKKLKRELERMKCAERDQQYSVELLRKALQQDSGVSGELLQVIIPLVINSSSPIENVEKNIALLGNKISDQLMLAENLYASKSLKENIGKLGVDGDMVRQYTGTGENVLSGQNHVTATDKTYDENEAEQVKGKLKLLNVINDMKNSMVSMGNKKHTGVKTSEFDLRKEQNRIMLSKMDAMQKILNEVNLCIAALNHQNNLKDNRIDEKNKELKAVRTVSDEQADIIKNMQSMMHFLLEYHEKLSQEFHRAEMEIMADDGDDDDDDDGGETDDISKIEKLVKKIKKSIEKETKKLEKEQRECMGRVGQLQSSYLALQSNDIYSCTNLFESQHTRPFDDNPRIIDVRGYQGIHDEVIAHNLMGQQPQDPSWLIRIEESYWDSVITQFFRCQPLTTYSNKTIKRVAGQETNTILIGALFNIIFGKGRTANLNIGLIGQTSETANPIGMDPIHVVKHVLATSHIHAVHTLIETACELEQFEGREEGILRKGEEDENGKILDAVSQQSSNIDINTIKAV